MGWYNYYYSSSINLNDSYSFKIDQMQPIFINQFDLRQKMKKKLVRIGYCCDADDPNARCLPQRFVLELTEGIFKNDWDNYKIIYQQCTQKGLPPLWTYNYSSTDIITSSSAVEKKRMLIAIDEQSTLYRFYHKYLNHKKSNQNQWYEPDIMLCQGYFYHNDLVQKRKDALNITLTPSQTEQARNHGILINDNEVFKIHSNSSKRPFLTTYNTESWGGGFYDRYDVVMDSVTNLRNRGCLSFHVPPTFFYEYERSYNYSDQLIRTVAKNTNDEYIEALMKSKLEFALMLVRMCYAPYYSPQALIRVIFFDMLLKRYQQQNRTSSLPLSLSACRRTSNDHLARYSSLPKNRRISCSKYAGGIETRFDPVTAKHRNATFCSGSGVTDGVVHLARSFKFYIAFENAQMDGYSTEKIMNAFYAETVPIYFGDENINKYINEKAYIRCHISKEELQQVMKLPAYKEEALYKEVYEIVKDSMQKCVDYVEMVDHDDELYKQYLKQPIFVNNTWKGTIMDPYIVGQKLKYALTLTQSWIF